MKRKALAITLAAAMAMGTCAVTASAADGDKYTIGICQLVQHEKNLYLLTVFLQTKDQFVL